MNLFDSAFLCLDIGTSGVRGCAHRVRSARLDRSAIFSIDGYDTVFAIKAVIDELEHKIGTHFDSAYITGNFGECAFQMTAKSTAWDTEHKITASDIRAQIGAITPPDGFMPMHIVPLRYDTPTARNMTAPIGHVDRGLISAFGAIFYEQNRIDEINSFLRRAHIQADAFMDSQFLFNATMRAAHETVMFIDMGAGATTVSIWTDRGPVWMRKIMRGGTEITNSICDAMHIDFDSAERIKRNVASMVPSEMDRFAPADTAFEFSRADINDIFVPQIVDIIGMIKTAAAPVIAKYAPTRIVVSGGTANADGVTDFIENSFGVRTESVQTDAAARALAEHIWSGEAAHRNAYIARSNRWAARGEKLRAIFRRTPRRRNRFIPIMPSTLSFNMKSDSTYSLFRSGGISMIHVDIMDGFYVDNIAGGIDELRYIRAHTDAHLHVHLMTESPAVWAADAVAAGADTVIVSTNTAGVRNAIRTVHAAGRRVGIALHPDSDVAILKPVLREIDEVMVMAVTPGAAGQSFNPACLHKISVLAATRKKYGLKFKISVDGGINAKTAALCWNAGADVLVSGSYLANAADFPLAVQGLMRNQTTMSN